MASAETTHTQTTKSRGLQTTTLVLLGILLAVVVLAGATVLFGPVALTMAALVLVPVMFILFLMISRP